jgi:hypothetical protein
LDRWRSARLAPILLTALVAACAGERADAPERTERERDSLIATSRLPGAAGVGAAMRAQDRASATNARIDSIAKSVR